MTTLSHRILALTAGLATLVPAMPLPAFAFSDVSTSTNFHTAIQALQEKGVLEGYSDGSFKPQSHINRAEFLKIILEARGFKPSTAAIGCFPDVKSEWFAQYICTAKSEGIIEGYPDGLFHPEKDVNFVEAGKILTLAYKQNIQGGSSDWYEPYARALESSKAIPTTVATLDIPLTRGEMAEMLWRISSTNTDQPSKGYLNVKYPTLSVNMASDTVQIAKSCVDLRAFAEEGSRTTTMYYGRGGGIMLKDAATTTAAPQAPSAESAAGASNSPDYSQTNVQVQGVDEADIVKTDGNYVYIVRNTDKSSVKIVQVKPGSAMKQVASIDLSADQVMAENLYLQDGKLIVIAQRSYFYAMPMMDTSVSNKMIAPGYMPQQSVPKLQARIYNVSTPASPTLERTLTFDGNHTSSRMIGDKLYIVLNQPVYWGYPGPIPLTEKGLVPEYEDSKTGVAKPLSRCAGISIIPHVPSPQYMTVAVIDTSKSTSEVKSAVVLGNAENIYSSLQNLYVANTEWKYDWKPEGGNGREQTNLYRFKFSDAGIALASQGNVPGRILNQFSMDESDNTFRIATTESEWSNVDGSQKTANNLYVLSTDLQTVGSIEDIAPGETIYSTRFLGDRAYMVTFQRIDPFFVIDLKDPRKPTILGKLKIPGYSDYLHPYDATHIIGFGKDAIDAKQNGVATGFAWYQGMKVAMFDVSDVSNPKEMYKLSIGDRGTESPLLHDHKALLFEKDRNLLAFPVMIAELSADQKKQLDTGAYGSPTFQGAQVYDISLEKGFVLRGTVTHYDDPETFKKAGDYWYSGTRDIQRILRVGDSLVTVSQSTVKSNDEQTLKQEGSVELK